VSAVLFKGRKFFQNFQNFQMILFALQVSLVGGT
jgi:hypothetical protein